MRGLDRQILQVNCFLTFWGENEVMCNVYYDKSKVLDACEPTVGEL